MTLTAANKKLLMAAGAGAVSGGLAYLSSVLVGAQVPGWRALILGTLVAGATRGWGAYLAGMQTTPPPPKEGA